MGHNLSRQVWEHRFSRRIAQRLHPDQQDVTKITSAELESWEDDDWLDILPEDAADENMMDWTDDGD